MHARARHISNVLPCDVSYDAARAASRSADAPRPVSKRQALAVKVCGVACSEDARCAASAGADLVGLILWPGSKRSVKDGAEAKRICDEARAGGARSVGVFVSECAAEVVAACEAAGADLAQLHGDGARAALPELLSARERGEHQLGLVYVVSAREDGSVVTEMPSDEQAAQVRLSVGDPQPGYFGYPKAMRPRASSFS